MGVHLLNLDTGGLFETKDIGIDHELRRAALKASNAGLSQGKAEKGITEEEVLEDFAAFRKLAVDANGILSALIAGKAGRVLVESARWPNDAAH